MTSVDRRVFLAVLGGTLACTLCDVHAASGPATVMLMRHGEDLNAKGVQLDPRGKARAEALPKLFGTKLPKPQVIIASHATKGSNRPVETVEPLARSLGMGVDNRFRDTDWALLAKSLLND